MAVQGSFSLFILQSPSCALIPAFLNFAFCCSLRSAFVPVCFSYSEACAADNSCLCKRGPASCSVSARLTLKISPKATARMAQRPTATHKNKHGIAHSSSWKSGGRPAATRPSPLPPNAIKSWMAAAMTEGFRGCYSFKLTVKQINALGFIKPSPWTPSWNWRVF